MQTLLIEVYKNLNRITAYNVRHVYDNGEHI